MLRSSQDTHVDHLRSLLDQRSTRAGSFSAISEDSDTPSVYRRPFLSPKSSDNSQYHPSPIFDIEPHLDNLDRPSNYTPSILDLDDLDDDQRSSIAPSEEINIDDTSYEDEDDNFAGRMSYLGPKMRVHSRAPWELEDDIHEEDAETEEGHRSFQSIFPFRGNGAKSVTSSSSSPRPSYTTSRRSGESSRSQVTPKHSFETINSQLSYQPGTFQSVFSFCLLLFTILTHFYHLVLWLKKVYYHLGNPLHLHRKTRVQNFLAALNQNPPMSTCRHRLICRRGEVHQVHVSLLLYKIMICAQ